MNTLKLTGNMYARMLRSGAVNLRGNIKLVNDLNVFPIPDGDTGDNMYMTIDSGNSMTENLGEVSLGETADAAAKGMLLGARGNSGVILSRIFAGISKGLEGLEDADVNALNTAFKSGVRESYSAVSVPVEGTILTVFKDAVHYAGTRITAGKTLEEYLDDFIWELKRSLERTPDLLDVLREAGVVDSGGAGLVYIAEGMRNALDGDSAEHTDLTISSRKNVDLNAFTEDSVLEFGYCTEFLLRLQRSKVDIENFNLDSLINWLNSVGDSVVAFREGSIVKVHVHTVKPGDVFNYVQRFGEFLTVKVENMTLQHNENDARKAFEPKREKPRKPYGIVSVASGKGIKEAFISLGCDAVVDGGQSMNPSAEDLIAAFREINADTILVFPNNGNIILTAKQAASLYEGADVRVVPSKTIGDGYAAISMLDTGSGDTDAILSELEEIISGVVTGLVSVAVRNAEMDGIAVKKDDYIGFVDDRVYIDSPSRTDAAVGLCENLRAERYDIMLVIAGSSVSPEEAQSLYSQLQKKYRRTEIVMIDGGQPVYDYIIILE